MNTTVNSADVRAQLMLILSMWSKNSNQQSIREGILNLHRLITMKSRLLKRIKGLLLQWNLIKEVRVGHRRYLAMTRRKGGHLLMILTLKLLLKSKRL